MSKTLEMIFKTTSGKTFTLRLADPKDGLIMSDVETVMQYIIDNDIFKSGGSDISQIVNARIRTVEDVPEA